MDEIVGKNKQKLNYTQKVIKVVPLGRIISAVLFITGVCNTHSYI